MGTRPVAAALWTLGLAIGCGTAGTSESCTSACNVLEPCASSTVSVCIPVDGPVGSLCKVGKPVPQYPTAPDLTECLNHCAGLSSSEQNQLLQCATTASGCVDMLACE